MRTAGGWIIGSVIEILPLPATQQCASATNFQAAATQGYVARPIWKLATIHADTMLIAMHQCSHRHSVISTERAGSQPHASGNPARHRRSTAAAHHAIRATKAWTPGYKPGIADQRQQRTTSGARHRVWVDTPLTDTQGREALVAHEDTKK